jgi:antitoxin ParD1/3/4
MDITLKPELEKFIQQQIKLGKYDSAERVIEEALFLLSKRNEYDKWVEEIGQKIDIAAEQLDRGEGIDGEIAINQLRKRLRQTEET